MFCIYLGGLTTPLHYFGCNGWIKCKWRPIGGHTCGTPRQRIHLVPSEKFICSTETTWLLTKQVWSRLCLRIRRGSKQRRTYEELIITIRYLLCPKAELEVAPKAAIEIMSSRLITKLTLICSEHCYGLIFTQSEKIVWKEKKIFGNKLEKTEEKLCKLNHGLFDLCNWQLVDKLIKN